MDPATLIVMALAKVLLPGAQAVAQRAMLDAYGLLKDAIVRKYGRYAAAGLAQLEQNPASPQVQAQTAQILQMVGADRDPEIVGLADSLRRLVEDPGSLVESSGSLEAVQRRAGTRAVAKALDSHVGRVMQVRSQYVVEDRNLLTANLDRSTNVPQSVRQELAQLHTGMRQIIELIAQKIEDGQYRTAEEAVADLRGGLAERDRASRLINADKQLHVSYQTLRLAVEFFSEFNDETLAKIEREASPEKLANMMLGNAIMIYELTDFVIAYIQSFSVRGMSDLEAIYADVRSRIADVRTQQDALERRASDAQIEAAVRAQTLQDIAARRGAIDEVEREWGAYVSEVKQLDAMVGEVRAKIPTLELIRDNAAVQISLLQVVALLRFLKQNSDAIRSTVAAVQGFRLAPLSSSRVRRLLGV